MTHQMLAHVCALGFAGAALVGVNGVEAASADFFRQPASSLRNVMIISLPRL
jgi:hypothetical protein